MSLYKKYISPLVRFKLLILVLTVLSGSNLLFGHTINGNKVFNKINYIAVKKSSTSQLRDNEPFLSKYSPVKDKNNNHTINLSPFEIEEEDCFSGSKKSIKSYHKTTPATFVHYFGCSHVNQEFAFFSHPYSFIKLPRYITYQVYRI